MWSDHIVLNANALQLTDDEFYNFCLENRDVKLERNEKGEIIIMPPTGFNLGIRNASINAQLYNWNKQYQLGVVVDSSTGIKLNNTAIREPDAAWISQERLSAVPRGQLEKFAAVWPEFIVELKSKTDPIESLKARMIEWIENGVQLGWLIIPEKQLVYLYHENREITEHHGFKSLLSGEPVLKNFTMDLSELI